MEADIKVKRASGAELEGREDRNSWGEMGNRGTDQHPSTVLSLLVAYRNEAEGLGNPGSHVLLSSWL